MNPAYLLSSDPDPATNLSSDPSPAPLSSSDPDPATFLSSNLDPASLSSSDPDPTTLSSSDPLILYVAHILSIHSNIRHQYFAISSTLFSSFISGGHLISWPLVGISLQFPAIVPSVTPFAAFVARRTTV